MIFFLRLLQENCRSRDAFVHRFDWPNQGFREFRLRSARQGCDVHTLAEDRISPKLLRMITSFHEDMKGTVQYEDLSSDPFPIKRGCVLSLTLFDILLSLLLRYAFSQSEEGVYLHARSCLHVSVQRRRCGKFSTGDGVHCRSRPESPDSTRWGRPARTHQLLCSRWHRIRPGNQQLNGNVMAQDVSTAPATSIGDCTLDEMENLHIYTTSKSLSLDTELNSTIAKHQQQWLACQKERGDSTRFTFDNYALDGALASHPYGICRIMLPTKTFWKR